MTNCPNTGSPCPLGCGSACTIASRTAAERTEIVRGIRSLRAFDLGPGPATDTAALVVARGIVRVAYHRIQRLPQDDPAVRVLVTELDEICVGLTEEIEAAAPELPMRRVAA